MTRTYSAYLYRDPLLDPYRMSNAREGTMITLHNNIDINVEGDHLLHSYITKLDEEIYSKMPDGLNPLAVTMWKTDRWNELSIKIADETRKHGWCVVQFYETSDSYPKRWRVFSVQRFTDYIRETYEDEEGNIHYKAVGMKFEWGDYLGNSFKEELRFDDPFTHLVFWREGDDMSTFAFPDLSQAIMTLAFEYRQIKGQMTFSAAKPSYQHFIYGDNCGDPEADELDDKIKGVDTTSAIGAKKDILEEIKTIENKNLAIILPAEIKQLRLFAGVTRLPVSYFSDEKETSGMSDMGEKTEMVKIMKKKEFIFNKLKPYLEKIFREVYTPSIDVSGMELPQEATLEEVEEEKDDVDTPNKTNKPDETTNGQKD